MIFPKKSKKGFSLVEVLISVAIFSFVSISCYKAFTQIIIYSKELEAKSIATMITNEQFEILRNLPYSSVGISGGVPAGVFAHVQNIARNGKQFEVTTTIRNYDDPFDGTIGGSPNDLSPADSKLVEISVLCTNCKDQQPSIFTSRIAPKGLETASTNGALFVRVFDGNGQPVIGADVVIQSVSGSSVHIEDVTNNSGLVQIIDIPPGIERYNIIVSKEGYTTDQTYASSVSNPNPIKPNATIAVQQVTQVSFSIDLTSDIPLSSKNLSCGVVAGVDFHIKGAKKIGQNPDLFKFDHDYLTNGSGIKNMSDIEWDTYDISIIDVAYNLAGTDPLLPTDILPGASQNFNLFVAPKTARNLLVIVKDSATGLPLSGVEVTLSHGDEDEILLTNEGFLAQTDWSGGAGQSDLVDDTKYLSNDGFISVNNPVGEVKLTTVGSSYVPNGVLTSSTFDIGSTTSASASFIRWKPTDQPILSGSNSVKFQIASSNTNNATTTWDFLGPDGTSSSFYTTSNQNIEATHQNKQYLRYKMFLSTNDVSVSPNVSDVALTYSSACTPPGQVYFGGLDAGSYTVTASKTGYQDVSVPITINSSGQQQIITLSP